MLASWRNGSSSVVFAAEVTPGFFQVVAVDTALGRPFVGDDGGPGADPVVVLTNGFWQRSFGSDLDVLGRSLLLETGSATIVGVMALDGDPPLLMTSVRE